MFNILNIFNKSDNFEFTFECNPESMDEEKIKLIKKYGVNRVSIGVQSFNNDILRMLNRKHNKLQVINIINILKKYDINNINIDMMFGINIESIETIKKDLNILKKLDIKHISYYSLILEPNTVLYINNYIEQDDITNADTYEYIRGYLKEIGYEQYEISNFSKENYKCIHNLTYWNNDEYYGFGLGAHGFIENERYENTRSITKYLEHKYKFDKYIVDKKTNMENEIILGFRKLKGIDKNQFIKKYKEDIYNIFNIKKYINNGTIIDDGKYIYIDPNYLYVSNEILLGLLESSSE